MGLRGCVDAWGEPVKKPELGGLPERFKPAASVNTVNKPLVNKPLPVNRPVKASAPDAAPPPAPPLGSTQVATIDATDRSAYMRDYMRAKRAKAKASKPG